MDFTIYGKDSCPWCDKAKELLGKYKFNFVYVDINQYGFDKNRLVTVIAPGAKTVPIVTNNYGLIGGYEKLELWVENWKTDVAKLRKLLASGETVSVLFTKRDGTQRAMTCTTNMATIPTSKHPKTSVTGSPIFDADPYRDVFTVYDVNLNEWRSFNPHSLLGVS